MVRWLRRHCPPDTGFEIRALAVWGRARYLSVTEAPHNTDLILDYRTYPSLPGSTPPPFRDLIRCLRIPISTLPSQNIPPPLFNKFICATLPEYLPLPPRIYPIIIISIIITLWSPWQLTKNWAISWNNFISTWPDDRQISMATREKTYHDVWKYLNPPIILWSRGGRASNRTKPCFLSLSLLFIDLFIADITLTMFPRLFWRPVPTIYFRRPIQLFSMIK